MKKEELKFKCVVPTRDKFNEIRKLLLNAQPTEIWLQFISWNAGCEECSSQSSVFCSWSEPLVSYEQALEMIAQIEPEQKGEWVEFEVDENGNYRPRPDVALFNWQENYIGSKFIFGGWLWERKDDTRFWGQDRFGVNSNGGATVYVHDWVKSLVPKKIRFWRAK